MSRKKKDVSLPKYRSNPSAISVTIYDLQGDPISEKVERALVQYAEAYVRDYGANSLAISVNRG
jgi:hypothetical protein